MANTPYPIDSAVSHPDYYALFVDPHDGDPTQVHPNRYSIYYDGDTVYRSCGINTPGDLPTTYTVRALLPSVFGSIKVGDVIKTGAIVLTTTSGSYRSFSMGTAGPNNDFPPGAYRVYLTGNSTDTRTVLLGPNNDVDCSYGPSYGVSQFVVLRTHPSALDIRTLNSTFATFNWKPNGFGRTNAMVDAGQGGGGESDMIHRAALSMGIGRTEMYGTWDAQPVSLNGPNFKINPSRNHNDETNAALFLTNVVQPYWLNPTNPNWVDSVRSRTGWMNYVGYFTCYDAIQIQNDGSQPAYLQFANIYPLTPYIDCTKLFIKVFPSSGGATVEVYFPDAATLVESHTVALYSGGTDTIAAAINGQSNYIRGYAGGATTNPQAMTEPVAIGTNCHDQLVSLVQSLAPLGITRYELPENEPAINEQTAHQFWLAWKAVQDAGVPGVKAIGCAPVTMATNWTPFLQYITQTAGLTKDDFGLSFHSYNTMTAGNINQGRGMMEFFLAQVRAYGLSGIEMWQTEGLHGEAGLQGVYMPWRASEGLRQALLWEQYGIPREQNTMWYDNEHGFWSQPTFLESRGHCTMQTGTLYSVLGQETFAQNHHHRIDFGSVLANNIFFGSLYGDPLTGSTAVLCCTTDMPNSTVTLQINGTTDALNLVDGCGVTSTATPDGSGRITVDVSYIPTYVKLPAGVTASVYSVRDWSHTPNPSVSGGYISATIGGNPAPGIIQGGTGGFMGFYTGNPATQDGISQSAINPPDAAVITFNQNFDVDRVTVFSAPPYQGMCAFINYTIDTWDGATWTTNTTVTKDIASSFRFGDGSCYGTIVEQLTDGGWIEDVTLAGGPITCKGVRISVSSNSDLTLGGAVDQLANSILNSWGGSTGSPKITLQRMEITSDTAFTVPDDYVDTVEGDSPIGYWKLNELSGATQAVSQVNASTLNSNFVGINFGDSHVVPSLADPSAAFTAFPNGYIQIPNNTVLNVGDTFSWEFWVRPESSSQFFGGGTGGHNLIDKGTYSNVSGAYNIKIGGTSGKITLSKTNPGSTTTQIAQSTSGLLLNTNYHIVVTKNGSAVHIYLNGQDVTGSVTNQTLTNNSAAIRFGDANARQGLAMGHVALYGTALSAAQVAAHYLAGVAPAPPTNVNAPFIEGTPIIGGQLQTSSNYTEDWSGRPTAYTFQWQSASTANGSFSDLSGQTRSDYLPVSGVKGKYLRCNVTASNVSGATSAIASEVVGPVVDVVPPLTGYWS